MNQNHKLFDEFKKKYKLLLQPIVKELKKQNFTKNNIDNFVDSLFQKFKIENKISDIIIDLSISAMTVGGVKTTKTTYNKTKDWLLKNNWFDDNLILSERIHKNIIKTKKDISSILKTDLGNSVNWQKSAQKIYKIKDIKTTLPKYIDEMVKEGKKVIQDPTLMSDFKKKIKLAQKKINKLSNLGYKNPRLKKAYSNIITQIEKSSVVGLDKAIDRAVLAKTKYYAERIARTEIASAYGNSIVYNAKKNKNIVGIKSVLSSRHNIIDICDIHAMVNQYGMGRGVFPKNKVAPFPYHVQ